MKKKSYRVIVDLDVRHQAAREVIAGILRFAAKHPEWDVQMRGNHPSNDGFMLDADWMPDGLIIDGTWETKEGRSFLSLPSLQGVIFISTQPPPNYRITHLSCTTDDRELAVTAAKLFRQHGLTNFAFVGTLGDEQWCEARKRFFRASLKEARFGLSVYRSPHLAQKDWSEERKAMYEWIKSLPKPCGIWAAYDQRAMHILDVCHKNGISVPEQVQVLGVDDESYICEQTTPTLSSLAPDFESGGHAAAEALHAILSGRTPQERKLKIGIRGIIERLSTTDLSGSSNRVSRALDLIRRKANEGITVAAVVKAIGGSERLLEKNFKEVVGHSICREIQDIRLTKVKELLKKTALPIDVIAEHCSFRNSNYLKNLFAKRFGQTMSAFRSANR